MHTLLRFIVLLVIVLLVTVSQLAGFAWCANPSLKEPHRALETFSGKTAADLAATNIQLLDAHREKVLEYAQSLAENKLNAGKMPAVGKANGALLRLGRQAKWLQQIGEPAGVDFAHRQLPLKQQLNTVIVAYRQLPAAERPITNIRNNAIRNNKAREREVQDIAKMVEQKKWPEAENKLYDAMDKLRESICFLAPRDQDQILKPYRQLQAAIDPPRLQQRRAAADQVLQQLFKSNLPQYETLEATLTRAADELGKNGTVTLGNESVNGQQFIAKFGVAWLNAHAGALRCRSIQWSRAAVSGAAQTEELKQLETRHAQFIDRVTKGLADLVRAEAGRADAETAPKFYVDYLVALAPFSARMVDNRLDRALQPALRELADKSVALKSEVATYEAATGELVRWRRKVVDRMAHARLEKYPQLGAKMTATMISTPQLKGLFPPPPATPESAVFDGSAPEILQMAAGKLVGQPVTTQPVLPTGDRRASQHDRRAWSVIPTGRPLFEQLQAMVPKAEAELLIDSDHPPLTLEVQRLRFQMRQAEFFAAGGSIADVQLEALLTHFAVIQPARSLVVPLGPLKSEPLGTDNTSRDALRQAVVQFDVDPHWAHDGYSFAELPAGM